VRGTTVANPEHLNKLKEGPEAWNEWRDSNGDVIPDLSGANLVESDLRACDLSEANLTGADLTYARLERAYLKKARLTGADLFGTDCNLTFFEHADFTDANLTYANLSSAVLRGATLEWAKLGSTRLADTDLTNVRGLATINHKGGSSIGIDTFFRSGGLPEEFLRGCGVPEEFIAYAGSLIGKPIEYYSCFISYSSSDDEFAHRLHEALQGRKIRTWFAPEDLKIGDRFRSRIDESIRVHDKLVLILSEHSIDSAWVRREVETALDREDREKRDVLFPIRVDDAIFASKEAWADEIRRTRHIGDFRNWKNHDDYTKAFERLVKDLKKEGPIIMKA